MSFNCDVCRKDYNEEPLNINGHGQYCNNCINKMIKEDMQ